MSTVKVPKKRGRKPKNIESDKIEMFTVVMTREKDKEMIKKRLGFLDSEIEV